LNYKRNDADKDALPSCRVRVEPRCAASIMPATPVARARVAGRRDRGLAPIARAALCRVERPGDESFFQIRSNS
jgi:hypothetical protein